MSTANVKCARCFLVHDIEKFEMDFLWPALHKYIIRGLRSTKHFFHTLLYFMNKEIYEVYLCFSFCETLHF